MTKITVKENQQGDVKVFADGLNPVDTITILTKAIYTYADTQHMTPKALAKILHAATQAES